MGAATEPTQARFLSPSGTRTITTQPEVALADTAPGPSTANARLRATVEKQTNPRILELALSASDFELATTSPAASPFLSILSPSPSENTLRDPTTSCHFEDTYDTAPLAPRELGHGGIGRVVLVFDRTLGRDVAMKELLPELVGQVATDPAASAALSARFVREARVTGQLEHPNIVPVYELGREPNGRLYYTMRVVRGRTLSGAIESGKTLSERLALINHFAGLCQAIAYAHSRGVLHRDIKPDNVMIGEFGETFVLDWGLAKIIDARSPQSLRAAVSLSRPPEPGRHPATLQQGSSEGFRTQLGNLVGTPLYMSPEQLLQSSEASKPTVDVWSLGVVLYFILTGQLPFAGKTLDELVSHILTKNPRDIRLVCPEAPRDLVAVAARALSKDPSARYPTARELVRDIVAYQAGEKVTAYDYGSIELIRRFVRRHRATVLISVAAFVVLAVLLYTSYRGVAAARDQALLAERRAISGEQQAKTRLSDVLLQRARQSILDGDYASSTLLAAGALELMERADARGMLLAQTNTERLQPIPLGASPQQCDALLWNVTKQQLACRHADALSIAQGTLVTEFRDIPPLTEARLVSLNDAGWLIAPPAATALQILPDLSRIPWPTVLGPAERLVASKDGHNLALLDPSGGVQIWDTQTHQRVKVTRFAHPPTALAFHPTEASVALGGYRGELWLWQFARPAPPILIGQARSTIHALAFSPRGNWLLSGGADRSVLLWDPARRQLSLMPFKADSPVTSLAWSGTEDFIAVGSKTTGIDLLDSQRYERALRVTDQTAAISELAFATGSEIIGTRDDQSAFRYRLERSQPLPRYTFRGNVLSLTWSEPGREVLIGGLGDKGLCHLQLTDATCKSRLPLRVGLVRKVVVSDDRKRLVVGGTGGKLELWDAVHKLPMGYIDVTLPEVRDLLLQGSDALYAVGTAPQLLKIALSEFRVVEAFPLPASAQCFAALPGHRKLVIGLRNGTLALWSLDTQRVERTLRLGNGWIMGLAASESDNWLFALLDDGALVRLALDPLQEQARTRLHTARPTTLAYSSRWHLLASGGEDRKVLLLEPSNPPRPVAILEEHQGTIRSLIFDDTTARLLSAGDDGMVRLWDLTHLRTSAVELRKAIESEYHLKLDTGNLVSTQAQDDISRRFH